MLHYRLSPILEQHQPDDKFGFRRNKRIDDIFVIVESITGKTNEWHFPLLMISLDLRRPFAKVKFAPLFAALREHNMPESYINLLSVLYENQKGYVNGSFLFAIE